MFKLSINMRMACASWSAAAALTLGLVGTLQAASASPIPPAGETEQMKMLEEAFPQDGGPPDDMSGPARRPKVPGIVVLFSGKQKEVSDNWVFQGSNKPGAWHVEDGAMITSGSSLLSKQQFLDFQLHVEFKVPYMPEAHGQERGNSGIGLLNTYELQVLDSYGYKEPGSGDCGAIYSLSAPLVNACKKPRQWQTYDVTFHAALFENGKKIKDAMVSVLLNGICVQNNTDIKSFTGIANREVEGPGPIYLQYHNNTVRFRNVWVLPLRHEAITRYEPK